MDRQASANLSSCELVSSDRSGIGLEPTVFREVSSPSPHEPGPPARCWKCVNELLQCSVPLPFIFLPDRFSFHDGPEAIQYSANIGRISYSSLLG